MNARGVVTRIMVLALISSIFIFFFCTPAQAQRDKFVFGSAIAHTGKFAREGTNLKKAYDFWAEKVNAQGGIAVGGKRYPVEIIYYSTRRARTKFPSAR